MSGSSSGGHDAAKTPGGGGAFAGLEGVDAPLSGLGTAASPLALESAALLAAASSDLEAVLKAEALMDLGLAATPERMIWLFHPFWSRGEVGLAPALVTGTTNSSGGTQEWLVGASASSRRVLVPGGGSGTASPHMFVTGASKKFWLKGRVRHVSGMAQSGDRSGFGILSGAAGTDPDSILGLDYAVSTTKWIWKGASGGSQVSTIDFADAAYHVIKAWRSDGVASLLKVDAETPVSGSARPGTGMPVMLFARCGAAGNQSMRAQWTACATEIE